jgi:hypothetical protein
MCQCILRVNGIKPLVEPCLLAIIFSSFPFTYALPRLPAVVTVRNVRLHQVVGCVIGRMYLVLFSCSSD